MPRKAKEIPVNEEIIEKVEKKKTKKATTTTKKVASSSKKNTTEKNSTATANKKAVSSRTKKTVTPSKTRISKVNTDGSEETAIAKSKVVTATKNTAAKKATTAKKATVAKEITATVKKATTAKKTTTTAKKATTAKKTTTTAKKATTAKKTTISAKKATVETAKPSSPQSVIVPEYYDLPYHYNQTVVKVLAQTPKSLFVYWDISDEDRENYIKQFGPDFFNNTVPFLRVKNESNGFSFDVDVDDFANGWYLHVENSKNNYSIELLRKQRPYVSKVIEEPVYISSSNTIETPNDHILFDSNSHTVFFRNVKTGRTTSKDISNIAFLKKIGKIYNIYDLYKRIYKSEDVGEIFDLNNPGSSNPTSTFM